MPTTQKDARTTQHLPEGPMPEHPPETRPEGNTTQLPTGYSFIGDPNETTLTPPHTPAPTQEPTNLTPVNKDKEPKQPLPWLATQKPPWGTQPPSPSPTEVRRKSIIPAPGPVSTPYDAQLDYNVHPLPNNFNST